MKKTMNITARLYDPLLLKNLVEKLASRHVDQGYIQANIPGQLKAIVSCSTMAYVMGNIDLDPAGNNFKEQISMPFTTRFMFTCIKEKYGLFQLEWSASLS
ncbi:MAG: hypothetical protein ABIO04_11160 [Ferruginibacter sp.]